MSEKSVRCKKQEARQQEPGVKTKKIESAKW